ncbi:unnamed protein product, partial [Phaeothamnion confervicola]
MKIAQACACLTTAIWAAHLFRIRRRHYARQGVAILLLFHCAALLEVYDFAPRWGRLVDAHAVWHAATVPLGFWWYRFLALDLRA